MTPATMARAPITPPTPSMIRPVFPWAASSSWFLCLAFLYLLLSWLFILTFKDDGWYCLGHGEAFVSRCEDHALKVSFLNVVVDNCVGALVQ